MATLVTIPRDLRVLMEEKRRQSLKVSSSLRQVGSLAPARASLIAQLVKKKSICNAGDPSPIPGLERSPGEGKGYPQYSGLENSTGCIVHGVAKSRTRLSDFHVHLTWAPASALTGSLSVCSLTDGRWRSDEKERENTALCLPK